MGGRCHPAGCRTYRHAGGRVQHDLWRRCRRMAGQAPGDPGRGLHRFAQGRQCPVPSGCRTAPADPGVRRDVQHQPGDPASRSARRPWRGHCPGTQRLGDPGLRPVLHQPRPDPRPALAPIQRLPRTVHRADGRAAGADHAQRRHPGQLPQGPGAPARASGHPPPGRRHASRTTSATATVPGRYQPAAQWRRTAAGRSLRPGDPGDRGRRPEPAGRCHPGPARPVDRHPDWRTGGAARLCLAGRTASGKGRPGAAQRLSHRGRSVRCDGSWRPVPGHLGCPRHLRRHPGHRPFPAAGVLPELP